MQTPSPSYGQCERLLTITQPFECEMMFYLLISLHFSYFHFSSSFSLFLKVTGILITHLLKPTGAGYNEEGTISPLTDQPSCNLYENLPSHWAGSFSSVSSVMHSSSSHIVAPSTHNTGKVPTRSGGKKLDPRVVEIITEMTDAIELSIWDAALDKGG